MTHDLLPLNGKKILITSGSTRAYLDAVRYISNTSTGELGREIATEALRLGASVTFLYGSGSLIPDTGGDTACSTPTDAGSRLTLIEIETIDDLLASLKQKLQNTCFDTIIHAMAVLDYVSERCIEGKVSSGKDEWVIKLVKAPKVIKIIRALWPDAFLIGFKLEVGKTEEELLQIAKTFQSQCKANLIVANRLEDVKTLSPPLILTPPQADSPIFLQSLSPRVEEGWLKGSSLSPGEVGSEGTDRHTAYFVNNKGGLIGVFHNKKAIAEGLMEVLR